MELKHRKNTGHPIKPPTSASGRRTEHVLGASTMETTAVSVQAHRLMIGTNNTGHEGREMRNACAIYLATPRRLCRNYAIIDTLEEKQPDAKPAARYLSPRSDKNDAKRQKNEAINGMIAKLGDREHVTYLNINENFLKPDGTLPKDIMPDLLHLNPTGYEI